MNSIGLLFKEAKLRKNYLHLSGDIGALGAGRGGR